MKLNSNNNANNSIIIATTINFPTAEIDELEYDHVEIV